MLCPAQWESSRHKHIMTGRDEFSLQSPVAKRIFPLWMSAILPRHPGISSPSFMETPCAVLTKTFDWHRWDFPTMLKGKVVFVPAQRQMDRLFGHLRSCLIFQFNNVRRWRLWVGIIDPNPASWTILQVLLTINIVGYMNVNLHWQEEFIACCRAKEQQLSESLKVE